MRLLKYFFLLGIFLLALWLLSLFSSGELRTAQLTQIKLHTKIILETPRCFLQNVGIIDIQIARYKPSKAQTIDINYCTPWAEPQLLGKKLKNGLIILSDFGGLVQRVDQSGQEIWRSKFVVPRGLAANDKMVFVGDGRDLVMLDITNGNLLNRVKFAEYISAIDVNSNRVAIGFKNEIQLFGFSNGLLEHQYTVKEIFSYPRGVLLTNDGVIVADTYGHRIVKVVILNGQENVTSVPSYFPNSVKFVNDNILVAEEHLNRISLLDATISQFGKTLFRCNTPISNEKMNLMLDLSSKGEVKGQQIMNESNPYNEVGESICSSKDKFFNGLFSPNDAATSGDMTYIADTDNHRIVALQGDKIASVLINFNDPVNLIILDH